MNDERRPSPDALLKEAVRDERGRLKILLGAAPGVGKTVEMLREGADLLAAGVDVVAGVIETHGRAHTEQLAAPFERLPPRTVEHEGHRLAEFDVDAMLARAPRVALVDELAHSNAPGSRHAKRWQDVEELRAAGIDVLTTLNIQHVESLNDVVASFTRIRMRETVPDSILDEAEIEIVDVPPDELIDRLKAGKIYVAEEANRALGNFFTRANLSALRELALRRAAQTVDRRMLDDLRASGARGNFAGAERFVVAVGDQPGGERLIRAAKRMADAFDAPWTALVLETPRSATLDASARGRIADALKLAASLGANVAVVPAADVVAGLAEFLEENRTTALVVGKVRRGWWFTLRHPSVVDKLVRELKDVSVHVIPLSAYAPADSRPARSVRRSINPAGLLWSVLLVGLTTVLARFAEPFTGPNSIDLMYILPVMFTAARFGLRSSLAAALMAALAYNFFFLPPLYELTIQDPQNVTTFLVLIAVGTVVGQLAGNLQRRAILGARTASENAAVAAFGQKLAGLSARAETAAAVAEEIAQAFGVSAIVVLRDSTGRAAVDAGSPAMVELDAIDEASADWAFTHNEDTGRGTGTLAASDWQFHPLATSLGIHALIGLAKPGPGSPIPPDRQLLFTTMKGQAALAYERIRLEKDTRELQALRQREDLRRTLLSSIAHDLRTPLTALVGAAQARQPQLDDVRANARRLAHFFDNLLEMTRLQEGGLEPALEPIDLTDAVAAALDDLKPELAGRTVAVDVPADLPLVSADGRMLHQCLLNLLANAARFTRAGGQIRIEAEAREGGVRLEVVDDGVGLPPGDPAQLFDRFRKVEVGDRSGGTGLGLAIVKGFADAMGIAVGARRVEPAGAAFSLHLPASRLAPGGT
ncbi:sensor histidine kinase KdpD [Sphingomonas sp. ASV193]|uniref:sensor histidine kinase KdpD n=1 Tax=Sphingomonas sp. ASV193 TaxID=3144405 RepID=UPI0032E8B29B